MTGTPDEYLEPKTDQLQGHALQLGDCGSRFYAIPGMATSRHNSQVARKNTPDLNGANHGDYRHLRGPSHDVGFFFFSSDILVSRGLARERLG